MLQTPSPADPDAVVLTIGGAEAEPAAVRVAGDSLLVELPRAVRREEVALTFSTVVERNATLFWAFVGNERQLEVWQPVDPVRRAATTVYLPSVPGTDQLIANLAVQSFISPNGDGIGDAAEIRFHVLKTDAPAQVQIYTLDGRLVRALEGQRQPDQSYLYIWTGQDKDERVVPPGSYLCRGGGGGPSRGREPASHYQRGLLGYTTRFPVVWRRTRYSRGQHRFRPFPHLARSDCPKHAAGRSRSRRG